MRKRLRGCGAFYVKRRPATVAVGVRRKQPLSGAQRRKRDREQKAVAERKAATKKAKGDLLVQDYTTAPWKYEEWRVESRNLYWDMRHHRIPLDDGRTLTWAAEINGRLAKMSEELAYLKHLNEQLQNATNAGAVGTQELLLANDGEETC